MKYYCVLVFLWCLLALSKGDWVRVWADDFDWDGGVDTDKWDFDQGGGGWGRFFKIYFEDFPSWIVCNLGNGEAEYYTDNRAENARCERFPGSANGRLIIEARKVRSCLAFRFQADLIFCRKIMETRVIHLLV